MSARPWVEQGGWQSTMALAPPLMALIAADALTAATVIAADALAAVSEFEGLRKYFGGRKGSGGGAGRGGNPQEIRRGITYTEAMDHVVRLGIIALCGLVNQPRE